MAAESDSGFTLMEILVAGVLGILVVIAFFRIMHFGILASNRGEISAEARENARKALERIESEIRQAAPLPTGQSLALPSAVIFPGSGGNLANAERAGVGCSVSPCVKNNASVLDPSVSVPAGFVDKFSLPFVIFSELIQQSGGTSGIVVPGGQDYAADPKNYVWVAYAVMPSGSSVHPSELVRYTFPTVDPNTGNLAGITLTNGQWQRDDNYFTNDKSREGANPPVIVALRSPADNLWLMVSHGSPEQSDVALRTGVTLDPQLFIVNSIVTESSIQSIQSHAPLLKAALSSSVRIEGSLP